MRRSPCIVVALFAAAAATLLAPRLRGEETSPDPCGQGGYRDLDFWLGDWDVYEGAALAGHNHIEKILRGCAVVEDWTDADGSEGRSLFFYDRFRATWKQVWVHDVGQLKEKTRMADPAPGAVRFQGTVTVAEGRTLLDRTTLSRPAAGQVRQVIEVSRDEGQSWRTVFDAIYVRPGTSPPAPAPVPSAAALPPAR